MVPEVSLSEMTLAEIEAKVTESSLSLVGAFHPSPEDGAPEGTQTLLLLGPGGPQLWQAFQASPEYTDGAPNPLDRWSERIIGALASVTGAVALYPFGGPPWQPFQKWAVKGEGAVSSPVSMQATSGRGLWTSYRGALGLRERLVLPDQAIASPCADCHAPCLTACPVDAFHEGAYDIPTCTQHLKSKAGSACLDGCLVRKVCPYGQNIQLPTEQRAFHIAAFLRANG